MNKPPTVRYVRDKPIYCSSTVPMTGPTAVPPEKDAITGAVVLVLFSAVLISDIYMVPPATNIETPNPDKRRHPIHQGVPNPGRRVRPMDPIPMAHSPIPAIMTGFLPYCSTKYPEGIFPSNLEIPKAEVTKPNSLDGIPGNVVLLLVQSYD